MKLLKPVFRCSGIAAFVLAITLAGFTQEPAVVRATPVAAVPAMAPAPDAAPPPAAPPKRSAAELEKLVASIALYPDPLIAVMLPASVYPLEIVQAARFVTDPNNVAKIDAQPWETNVKEVAKFPDVLKKMNDDLNWTVELGQAFLDQPKEVMDAIQSLRAKAQASGALKTTPQMVVTTTNIVVERIQETKVVVVTNTVIQVQPANPQVVYVPTYNPTVVYAAPPPTTVVATTTVDPYVPLLTFAAGVAVGALFCDDHYCGWHDGGCYGGSYYGGSFQGGSVNIDNSRNFSGGNNTINSGNRLGNRPSAQPAGGQKWRPDQNRMRNSGAMGGRAGIGSSVGRGWGSGGARPSTLPSVGAGARPSTGVGGARPSTLPSAGAGTRPSTGFDSSAARPSTRPSTGFGPSAARPSTQPSTGLGSSAARPSTGAGSSYNRPSTSQGFGGRTSSSGSSFQRGGDNAFGGIGNASSTRASSNRGSSSRSSSSFSGSSGGSRGGSRGGGGGGGRR
jgi:hypothetical protein